MKKVLMSAMLAAFLVACGGGGDDSQSTVASTSSFPFAAGHKARVAAGAQEVLAVSGSCTGTVQLNNGPAVISTFQGVSGFVVSQTLTLSGCSSAATTIRGRAYYDSEYAPLGDTADGIEYTKFLARPPAIPAMAKVGDAGSYASYAIYSDPSYTSLVGQRNLSYIVEPDTASTAIVNLVSKSYNRAGQLLATQQTRYRIASSGTLTLVSIDSESHSPGGPHLVYTKR